MSGRSLLATEPALVPELLVADTPRSLEFWCGLCGFEIAYDRPEEGFAYLVRDGAHVMLEQQGVGRNWVTGELARPLGRGVNFQIAVDDLAPILEALRAAGVELFMEPETKWYRVGGTERAGTGEPGAEEAGTEEVGTEEAGIQEAGTEQFLVTDPDGYLIRFQRSLGRRTVKAS